MKESGPAAKIKEDYVLDPESIHSRSSASINVPEKNPNTAASSGKADGRKDSPREAPTTADEWYGGPSGGPRAPLPPNVERAYSLNVHISSDEEGDDQSDGAMEGGVASAKPSPRVSINIAVRAAETAPADGGMTDDQAAAGDPAETPRTPAPPSTTTSPPSGQPSDASWARVSTPTVADVGTPDGEPSGADVPSQPPKTTRAPATKQAKVLRDPTCPSPKGKRSKSAAPTMDLSARHPRDSRRRRRPRRPRRLPVRSHQHRNRRAGPRPNARPRSLGRGRANANKSSSMTSAADLRNGPRHRAPACRCVRPGPMPPACYASWNLALTVVHNATPLAPKTHARGRWDPARSYYADDAPTHVPCATSIGYVLRVSRQRSTTA